MSQEHDILYHLHNIGSITPIDALKLYGCFRLSGRIYDLKAQGHDIGSTIVEENGKSFASYSLAPKKGQIELFI